MDELGSSSLSMLSSREHDKRRRTPKCLCHSDCPDTLTPVCASDGRTVSEMHIIGKSKDSAVILKVLPFLT